MPFPQMDVWSRWVCGGVGPISNGSIPANHSDRYPIDYRASGNPSVRSRERSVFPRQVLIMEVPRLAPWATLCRPDGLEKRLEYLLRVDSCDSLRNRRIRYFHIAHPRLRLGP